MSDFPEDIFQNILNNPDAMKTIGSMLSSLQGNGTENSDAEKKEPEAKSSAMPGLDNPEFLLKIAGIYKKISSEDDSRVNLLMALKPHLSEKRADGIENAVKLLKLSKMSSVFGDLNIL